MFLYFISIKLPVVKHIYDELGFGCSIAVVVKWKMQTHVKYQSLKGTNNVRVLILLLNIYNIQTITFINNNKFIT